MDPNDLFQPLFSSKRRQPSRREYIFGGLFCTAMAAGSWFLDISKSGTIALSVLAAGCFGLAARSQSSAGSPTTPSDSAAGRRDA